MHRTFCLVLIYLRFARGGARTGEKLEITKASKMVNYLSGQVVIHQMIQIAALALMHLHAAFLRMISSCGFWIKFSPFPELKLQINVSGVDSLRRLHQLKFATIPS